MEKWVKKLFYQGYLVEVADGRIALTTEGKRYLEKHLGTSHPDLNWPPIAISTTQKSGRKEPKP